MSSVSRCISSVSQAIAMKVKDYITFPTDSEDICKVMAGFFNKTGFPSIIGVIDRTLILTKAPSDDEPLYVCRKRVSCNGYSNSVRLGVESFEYSS